MEQINERGKCFEQHSACKSIGVTALAIWVSIRSHFDRSNTNSGRSSRNAQSEQQSNLLVALTDYVLVSHSFESVSFLLLISFRTSHPTLTEKTKPFMVVFSMRIWFLLKKNRHNNRTKHTTNKQYREFYSGFRKRSIHCICTEETKNSVAVMRFHSYYGVALRLLVRIFCLWCFLSYL